MPDPLAVRCRACLAAPGEPCIGTTSDLPRERVHRLRPLAGTPRLVRCESCEGSGWQPTGRTVAGVAITCPVCDAAPHTMCTEGGTERSHLHVVRRRAAKAGLVSCEACDAVGWLPEPPEPEGSAPVRLPVRLGPSPLGTIPGEVPEGVVPPSASMAVSAGERAPDVPDDLLDLARQDIPEGFDGCARECRKAGAHTHVWGRCGEAPEPTPPSEDDLRGLLIAADLASHVETMDDGMVSVVVHTAERAADRALAVFQQWMFGTPEEVAARKVEADARTPDDTVRLCEMARPGEHERRVRERMAAELETLREDVVNKDKPYNQAFMHGVDCAIRAVRGGA